MTKPKILRIPILEWLPSYRREWLPRDLVAGLTSAAVVVPKAMAIAVIAGLPLVVGLYTALVPLVVYACLGTSRPLSVTSTTTIAILSASILGQVAPGGDPAALIPAAATLSLLVGAFLLAAGMLRVGAVANLMSDPVLTGFKAGIGLVIVLDQLPKLLGVHIDKAGFFPDLLAIAARLPATSLPTLLFALAMLALMLGLEHFTPRVPAPLVTIAVGIAAAGLIDLEGAGIALVGPVQAGLPSFVLPGIALAAQLWPAALGIALMSFVESAAAGRAFVKRGDPPLDPDQELRATGLANLAGSFFQIMPAGGGTSQTAVNDGAGARSQVAGLVTAGVVVATLLFLAPLFGLMPHPTLAAVVVVASVGLISPSDFRAIRQIRTMEFGWALLAVAGVLLLGTLNGILVAVLASLVALVMRVNRHPLLILGRKPGTTVFRPLAPEHPQDETIPGVLLLRPAGGLYFGNAPRIGQTIRALIDRHHPRALVLDMSAVPELEFTALRMLTAGEETLRNEGTALYLAALNPEVLAVIQKSPLWSRLGRERMFFTLEQAVAAIQGTTGGAHAAPETGSLSAMSGMAGEKG